VPHGHGGFRRFRLLTRSPWSEVARTLKVSDETLRRSAARYLDATLSALRTAAVLEFARNLRDSDVHRCMAADDSSSDNPTL